MSKKKFVETPEEIKQDDVEPIKGNEVEIEEYSLTDLIKRQDSEIEEAIGSRGEFITKQNKFYRQRYGLRKRATFPWINASSQHLPMQDITIRKFKPEYVSVGYDTFPMCELTTDSGENLQISEEASFHFDWLLRIKMDVFEQTVLMTDKMLEKGFCIVKVIYSKEFESKIVTIDREDLIKTLQKKLLNPADITLITDPARLQELSSLIAREYGFDIIDDNSDIAKVNNICLELYKETDIIEFTVQEKKYDAPKWIVLDPKDIIVPDNTESVFDLERARWICHRYYITPAEAIYNMRIGKWKESTVVKLCEQVGVYDLDLVETKYKSNKSLPAKQEDQVDKTQKRTREGVLSEETEKNILINEVCMWFDSDNDGLEERHILEYGDSYKEEELRFIRYPYEMRLWPYVKVIFELADSRHYSNRGTVELEESLAVGLNVQHNKKVNRQTISSTPTLLYAASKLNPNNLTYVPGNAMAVEAPVNQNASWFMPPNTDDTFMREEATLKNWDAELMAANDWGSSMPNQSNTAKEYMGNQSNRVGIRQLDIKIFQKSLKELYKRTFSLWIQFSSESRFIYVDTDGVQKFIDKATLTRDWQFQPMGSFGSSNPTLSAQVAQRMYETFRGDTDIDQYELKREFITKQADVRTTKRILLTKQQIAKNNEAMKKEQIAAHQQQIAEEITLAQVGVKVGDFKPVQPAPQPSQPEQKQEIGQKEVGG